MKKTLTIATTILAMSAPTLSAKAVAKDFTKAEIEQIIADYLANHGDKIMEGVSNYQNKQEQDKKKSATEKIANSKAYLNDSSHPSIGPKDADVTIVEFFDYNCGYCKRAFADIQKIIETDKKTKFIFLDMPILGPTSLTASQWALAANEQGKYFKYHTELMNHKGPKTVPELEKIAKKIGLDIDKMKKDANSAKINETIKKSSNFAREIGVNGTPAFIAGEELIPGYIGQDGMTQKILDLRSKK